MQTTPSINQIKDLINQIEEKITEVILVDGQYGPEQEYTHQTLLDRLTSILTDLKTLTENPVYFLDLSTHQERTNIHSHLQNCLANLSNPEQLEKEIAAIKQVVRPFNIRHTQERFQVANNKLTELDQALSKLRQDIKIAEQNKTQANETLKSSLRIHSTLEQQQQDLTKKLSQAGTQIQESQNYAEAISQLKNTVDSQKPVVDTFVQKISEREQQLENQKTKTDTYNSQLIKFTDEHKKRLQEAEELIAKAKTALGYKQAGGISAAFRTRLDGLENVTLWKNANTYWLIVAISFSFIVVWLGYDFIQAIKNITDTAGADGISLKLIAARFLVLTLPATVSVFCAGQYIKNRNITEDYAYKTILAQSIIGFSEQLKSNDQSDSSYQNYVKKMLDEIHQHPLRNHKKHSTNRSPWIAFRRQPKEDKSLDE